MTSATYMIWLTLMIDGIVITTLPFSSEQFNNYIVCAYNAIEVKNQLGIILKAQSDSFTVAWACIAVK
jgi:hypothetical protein